MRLGETAVIDAAIVGLSGASSPRLLFLPTASGDAEPYVDTVKAAYKRLGCRVDALRLVAGDPGRAEIDDAIGMADIVYVGGGDTSLLMKTWRRTGVDVALRRAHDRGAILAGLSAGSMCWFDSGVSDFASFVGGAGDEWEYDYLDCLGFVPGCHSPHFDDRLLESNFRALLGTLDRTVLAVDNRCAVFMEGDSYSIVRGTPGAGAYAVKRSESSFTQERLPDSGSLAAALGAMARTVASDNGAVRR